MRGYHRHPDGVGRSFGSLRRSTAFAETGAVSPGPVSLLVGYALVLWLVVRPLGTGWAHRVRARSVLGTAQTGCLTTAFEALGPERVARGMNARGHGWHDCFLALAAYGTEARSRALTGRWWRSHVRRFSQVIDTPAEVVREAVRAWDRDPAAVLALAGEWLEQRHRRAPGRARARWERGAPRALERRVGHPVPLGV